MTNDELARQFLDVMSRTSLNTVALRSACAQIRRASGSIPEAFVQHGSLSNFHIPMLPAKFYPVPECILAVGVERTSELVIKKDVSQLRARAFVGIPDSANAHVRPDSTSPGCEDARDE